MNTEITTPQAHPTDPDTGLILPLSRSLGSRELAKHKSAVAVELEVMAKKMDRFGWDRDRGTIAHDRLLTDWMDALCDYPLEEVKSACREWVKLQPRKMPNEGDILKLILAARREMVRSAPRPQQQEELSARPTAERARQILEEVGFKPKRFGA